LLRLGIIATAFALLGWHPANAAEYYYCDPLSAYYPYVQTCPAQWRKVVIQATPDPVPPAAPVVSAPAPLAPSALPVSATFQDGLRDRASIERWFATTTGDYHDGAFYWSGERSKSQPGTCDDETRSVQWCSGCLEARIRFSPTDMRRKSEPDYRRGWNSWSSPVSAPQQVASATVSRAPEPAPQQPSPVTAPPQVAAVAPSASPAPAPGPATVAKCIPLTQEAVDRLGQFITAATADATVVGIDPCEKRISADLKWEILGLFPQAELRVEMKKALDLANKIKREFGEVSETTITVKAKAKERRDSYGNIVDKDRMVTVIGLEIPASELRKFPDTFEWDLFSVYAADKFVVPGTLNPNIAQDWLKELASERDQGGFR
jgi:hypothetical protein